MSNQEFLRPKEVREILKISDKTIYNCEKSGKLTCIRTRGGNLRFLRTDIFPDFNEKKIAMKKEKSVTVESQPVPKKKIWKNKLNSSNKSTQITK